MFLYRFTQAVMIIIGLCALISCEERLSEASHSTPLKALPRSTTKTSSTLRGKHLLENVTSFPPNISQSYLNMTQIFELQVAFFDNETFHVNTGTWKEINIVVSLICFHPSTLYMIYPNSDNTRVVLVKEDATLTISCSQEFLYPWVDNKAPRNFSEVVRSNRSYNEFLHSLPMAKKQFVVSVYGNTLGRADLVFMAKRHSQFGTFIPWVLCLPWESPKSFGMLTNAIYETVLPASTAFNVSDAKTASQPMNSFSNENVNAITEIHEISRSTVSVFRVKRAIDLIFRIALYSLVIVNTVGYGCKVEIDVVKEVLRRPVAPAIGFLCQYLCMPLVAFAISKLMVPDDPATSLGIFCCGICPGGGMSNMFAYLLDGDVSLSVTMTGISTVGSLVMIPLWLYTLGSTFSSDKINLNVPFGTIVATLSILIIPLLVGVTIKKHCPRISVVVLKCLRPFTLLAVAFILSFGIYVNLYVFRMFNVSLVLAACMLPYVGYALGAIASFAFKQSLKRIKTIAIETGIQNTSIAYLLLFFSLPSPDDDMAAIAPMTSALMTPLPLFVLVIMRTIYKQLFAKKRDEELIEAKHARKLNEHFENCKIDDNNDEIKNMEKTTFIEKLT